jgi:hypothetical protein
MSDKIDCPVCGAEVVPDEASIETHIFEFCDCPNTIQKNLALRILKAELLLIYMTNLLKNRGIM